MTELSLTLIIATCLLVLWIATSYKIPRADEGIESYLFAQWRRTVLPIKFRKSLNRLQRRKYDQLEKIEQGDIFDIVIGLRPFWKLVRFPTSPTKLVVYATHILTRRFKKHPRVSLEAYPSMIIRFLTGRSLILGVGFKDSDDLTEEVTIKGHGDVEYEDSVLAKALRELTKDLIRDAVRKTASSFWWDSGSLEESEEEEDDEDDPEFAEREINTSKRLWEKALLFELASPESAFAQSNILTRPLAITANPEEPGFWAQLKLCDVTDFFGTDVLSVDINIEKIKMARLEKGDTEAQASINEQFEAIQLAASTVLTGNAAAKVIRNQGAAGADVILLERKAEAAGAKALQESLEGVPATTIAALTLLENKDVKIIPIGGNLGTILEQTIGGGETKK